MQKSLLIIGFLFLTILSVSAFKLFYMGYNKRTIKASDYELAEVQTLHAPLGLYFPEERSGYYRIYDSDGKKVYQLFSDSLAWDIVITSDQQVEFQLNNGETLYWRKTK